MRMPSGESGDRKRFAGFGVAMLLAAIIVTFQGGAAAAVSEEALSRSSDQGPVYVEVLWTTPLGVGDSTRLDFSMRMTTHSGDLTALDFPSLLTLATSDGPELDGFSWTYQARSSHHPQAVASLPAEVDGTPAIGPQAEWIELRLKNVGGVPLRSFRWELDPDLHAALGHETPQEEARAGQSQDKPAVPGQGAGNYRILVPNALDGTVTVVDARSFTVEKTLPIGGAASHGIAVHPDGDRFFVADAEIGRLKVIDARSGEGLANLDLGHRLHGVDVSPDGRYVALAGAGNVDLVMVDRAGSEALVQSFRFPEANPSHIDFAPDGRYIYVTLLEVSQVSVLAYTGRAENPYVEVARLTVGENPNESRASSDGTRLYTANWVGDSVTVTEVGTWQTLATLPTGDGTHGVAVSPDGRWVWTANRISNDLTVIDAESLQVARKVQIGTYPNHLAFGRDGQYLYVTNMEDQKLAVLDTRSDQVVARIPVGQEPHEVDFASVR